MTSQDEPSWTAQTRMTRYRSGIVSLLIAGGLLAGIWSFVPLSPPLYDGLTFPSEPYRYLHPPPGNQTSIPPRSTSFTQKITGKVSPLTVVLTGERPPQARLILNDGALAVHPGTTSVSITIQPVPAPVPPPGGTIDGNVYRFSVTDKRGTDVPLTRNAEVSIDLRITGKPGTPVIELFQNGQWLPQPTHQYITTPLYSTHVHVLGYYAIVIGGRQSVASSGTPILPFVAVGVVLVALVAILLVLVRLRRRVGE
ncbi:MAG: hypothetical protein NVSMB52_14250 [Chloroflexota bacterium]